MNLETRGDIGRATYEPIRLGAGIRNLHVASGDGRSFRSGARPQVRDFKRPDLVIAGLGRGCGKADEASQYKNEISHDAAPDWMINALDAHANVRSSFHDYRTRHSAAKTRVNALM